MPGNLFTATAANLIKTASYTKLHIPFFKDNMYGQKIIGKNYLIRFWRKEHHLSDR